MIRPILLRLAIGAAVLLNGAHHAEASEPAAEQAAKKRFAQGTVLFKQGNYEGARGAFLDAYALAPLGFILRNVAAAEMRLGRPIEALRHLRGALASPDLSSDRRAIVQKDLDEAYGITGHVSLNVADGATVTVDGAPVEGLAPFKEPIDVMPGHHVLEARLGSRTAHAETDAKAGTLGTVSLDVAAPPPPIITTPAPATLVPTTSTAPQREEVPEGFWTTRRDVGLVVTGAGLLALGAGLAFDIAGQGHANKASSLGLSSSSCFGPSQPATCATQTSEYSAEHTDGTLNRVFLTVGIVGVAAGAAVFFWPASTSHVAVAPMATPYGGGLQLRGDL